MGTINGEPVAFFAVIHFPHPKVKNFKRGHRLVVLPDYQGLGIGHQLSSFVAQHYLDQGYRFIITSSTKSLFTQRQRDKRWIITRKGRTSSATSKSTIPNIGNTVKSKSLTYSYEYIGETK